MKAKQCRLGFFINQQTAGEVHAQLSCCKSLRNSYRMYDAYIKPSIVSSLTSYCSSSKSFIDSELPKWRFRSLQIMLIFEDLEREKRERDGSCGETSSINTFVEAQHEAAFWRSYCDLELAFQASISIEIEVYIILKSMSKPNNALNSTKFIRVIGQLAPNSNLECWVLVSPHSELRIRVRVDSLAEKPLKFLEVKIVKWAKAVEVVAKSLALWL